MKMLSWHSVSPSGPCGTPTKRPTPSTKGSASKKHRGDRLELERSINEKLDKVLALLTSHSSFKTVDTTENKTEQQ